MDETLVNFFDQLSSGLSELQKDIYRIGFNKRQELQEGQGIPSLDKKDMRSFQQLTKIRKNEKEADILSKEDKDKVFINDQINHILNG